jgi:hypothetical protein
MTTDTESPRDQQPCKDTVERQPDRATQDRREKISETVAEDHARLLGMLGRCLAEVGIKAALTTFYGLVLRAESFHLPARYEPELDVFWPDDRRPSIALKVKLVERNGHSFYAWGGSWASGHPASDPAGAVVTIVSYVTEECHH